MHLYNYNCNCYNTFILLFVDGAAEAFVYTKVKNKRKSNKDKGGAELYSVVGHKLWHLQCLFLILLGFRILSPCHLSLMLMRDFYVGSCISVFDIIFYVPSHSFIVYMLSSFLEQFCYCSYCCFISVNTICQYHLNRYMMSLNDAYYWFCQCMLAKPSCQIKKKKKKNKRWLSQYFRELLHWNKQASK